MHTLTETAEARAQKLVAVTFFLLAPYIVYDAVTTSADRRPRPDQLAGHRIADRDARPGRGQAAPGCPARLRRHRRRGTQNLLCAYLAVAVLAGLLANALLGWWWLDPVVALGIAGLAVREGVEAWHARNAAEARRQSGCASPDG